VGPRAGLDNVEKRKFLPPPGLELLPLGRPARSQSLYRLSRKTCCSKSARFHRPSYICIPYVERCEHDDGEHYVIILSSCLLGHETGIRDEWNT
jgi:hypothetical protein